MRALTLKAPWAAAIAKLGKDVENRSWKPSSAHNRIVPALTRAGDHSVLVVDRTVPFLDPLEPVSIQACALVDRDALTDDRGR